MKEPLFACVKKTQGLESGRRRESASRRKPGSRSQSDRVRLKHDQMCFFPNGHTDRTVRLNRGVGPGSSRERCLVSAPKPQRNLETARRKVSAVRRDSRYRERGASKDRVCVCSNTIEGGVFFKKSAKNRPRHSSEFSCETTKLRKTRFSQNCALFDFGADSVRRPWSRRRAGA